MALINSRQNIRQQIHRNNYQPIEYFRFWILGASFAPLGREHKTNWEKRHLLFHNEETINQDSSKKAVWALFE